MQLLFLRCPHQLHLLYIKLFFESNSQSAHFFIHFMLFLRSVYVLYLYRYVFYTLNLCFYICVYIFFIKKIFFIHYLFFYFFLIFLWFWEIIPFPMCSNIKKAHTNLLPVRAFSFRLIFCPTVSSQTIFVNLYINLNNISNYNILLSLPSIKIILCLFFLNPALLNIYRYHFSSDLIKLSSLLNPSVHL